MTFEQTKVLRDKIIKGLELTSRRLIKQKKDRNLDVVVSRNGKVVRIKAKDL